MSSSVPTTKSGQVIAQFETFFQIYEAVSPHLQIDETQRRSFTQRASWIDRLKQAEFAVAFFGSFSAGKSTIINAIMGREVLPESTKSTTAFPTIIRAGASDGAVVYYVNNSGKLKLRGQLMAELRSKIGGQLEGVRANEPLTEYVKRVTALVEDYERKSEKIDRRPLEQLEQLAAGWDRHKGGTKSVSLAELRTYTEGHPEALFIDRIEVSLADVQIPPDVILVDLPGLDVVNQRHIQYTKDYIQREAKAFVVCVKPFKLLEGQEISFLDETNRSNPTILKRSFWVINQWDTLNEQQRREEVQNFEQKIKQYRFNINADRFFKVSALNYLLLRAVAEGTLDSSEKLKLYVDDHLSKVLGGDAATLRRSPELARQHLERNDEARAFAEFRNQLFHYLNTTARDEFLANARAELLRVVSDLIAVISPLYLQFQGEEDLEKIILGAEAAQQSRLFAQRMRQRIDQFSQQIRNTTKDGYWNAANQPLIEQDVQAMLEVDREQLKNELKRGIDVHGDLSRLPGFISKRIQPTQALRHQLIEAIDESFVHQLDVLLLDLRSINKDFLPETVSAALEDTLSKRDVAMRLHGLADYLFYQFGETMQEIGFSLGSIKAPSLDESIDAALQLYRDGLREFITKLPTEINRGIAYCVENHVDYLEQELGRLLEEQSDTINRQIARSVNVNETVALQQQRRNTIVKSYEDLIRLRKEL